MPGYPKNSVSGRIRRIMGMRLKRNDRVVSVTTTTVEGNPFFSVIVTFNERAPATFTSKKSLGKALTDLEDWLKACYEKKEEQWVVVRQLWNGNNYYWTNGTDDYPWSLNVKDAWIFSSDPAKRLDPYSFTDTEPPRNMFDDLLVWHRVGDSLPTHPTDRDGW